MNTLGREGNWGRKRWKRQGIISGIKRKNKLVIIWNRYQRPNGQAVCRRYNGIMNEYS